MVPLRRLSIRFIHPSYPNDFLRWWYITCTNLKLVVVLNAKLGYPIVAEYLPYN